MCEGRRGGGEEGGEVTSAGDFVSEVNVCVFILYYMEWSGVCDDI